MTVSDYWCLHGGEVVYTVELRPDLNVSIGAGGHVLTIGRIGADVGLDDLLEVLRAVRVKDVVP